MKHLLFSLLILSSLSSHAGSPLKAELLPPTDPVVLDAGDRAIMEEVAKALTEQQKLENEFRKNPKGKRDFARMRALEEIISKGRKLKQGITLTLRLTNLSAKPMKFFYGADTSTNTLEITGPGALDLKFTGPMTMDYRQGKPTTIAPGKHVDFPISDLHHGPREASRWLLSQPGEYTIKIAFRTQVNEEAVSIASTGTTLEVTE